MFSLSLFQTVLLCIILFLNLFTFLLYRIDKKRAIKRQKRISERKLLFFSFLFGGVGATLAMSKFRHKTQKIKFKLSILPILGITFYAVYWVSFCLKF